MKKIRLISFLVSATFCITPFFAQNVDPMFLQGIGPVTEGSVDYSQLPLTAKKYLSENYSNDRIVSLKRDFENNTFEVTLDNDVNLVFSATGTLETPRPTLKCATKFYALPGTPVMHKMRTDNPQVTMEAFNLPEGLRWNKKRSLVEGTVNKTGDYIYNIWLITPTDTIVENIYLTVSDSLAQPTPIMGWLSWNVVEGDISQKVVEEVADRMVSTGLKDAGYRYLIIDDLWQSDDRDLITGNPQPDPLKFPNGIKAVADYVHDKGLQFGIYSDAGDKTCAGRYGSYGYEDIDARAYASWDVDLLKYDYCHVGEATDRESAISRYTAMGDALKKSGRDIILYMCEWGERQPWEWGAETGATTWRCTLDTRDGWNGVDGGIGLLQSLTLMKDLWPYSGVNRFNDADMMCVGIHGKGKSSSHLVETAGMTDDEYATQFIMWCMWSSPLTLSFDLREPIDNADMALITNAELIALNQDPLGQQAELVKETDNGLQYYVKDLVNGDFAVAVVNLGAQPQGFTIVSEDLAPYDANSKYDLRDLKKHRDLGTFQGDLQGNLNTHETKVYRFSRR